MPFHGYLEDKESNIEPMIKYFPKWNIKAADKLWCAAFVYYCWIEAGFQIPYSPNECISCSLAGCGGWEEYAMGDSRIEYHKREENTFDDNISRIIECPIDEHIRAYIRIPDGYRY